MPCSDWFWETTRTCALTYLSALFAELTGHTAQAWLQRPITERVSWENALLVHMMAEKMAQAFGGR